MATIDVMKKAYKLGDCGSITTADGSRTKKILIKYRGLNIKDLVVGSALIAAGVLWMNRKAFYDGADRYMTEELNVMKDLGIID